jgi:hypothetical protein
VISKAKVTVLPASAACEPVSREIDWNKLPGTVAGLLLFLV